MHKELTVMDAWDCTTAICDGKSDGMGGRTQLTPGAGWVMTSPNDMGAVPV